MKTPRQQLIDDVIMPIIEKHRLKPAKVLGPCRAIKVTICRGECMMALRKHKKSLAEIGRFFGKDHTSVIHGIGIYLVETDQRELYPTAYDYTDRQRREAIRRHQEKIKQAIGQPVCTCPTCGAPMDTGETPEILRSIKTTPTRKSIINHLVDRYPRGSDGNEIVMKTYSSRESLKVTICSLRKVIRPYGWTIAANRGGRECVAKYRLEPVNAD